MVDQRNQNSSSGSQDRGTPGGEGPKLGQGGASMSQASNPAAGQAADRNRGASAGSGQSVSGSKENESGMAATMRDTVGAVKEKASEALEGASGWAEDTYDRVSDWASEAGRTERFGDMRRQSSQSMRRMTRAPGICGGKSDGSRNRRSGRRYADRRVAPPHAA